jgi:tRNA-Thr(GGU) m(6)t(6)A37 methyltransferase TsaA
MEMMAGSIRPGEVAAELDPAAGAGDAHLVFIGRARTPWVDREDCPKNVREARERGGSARIEINPPWRLGLSDLSVGEAIIILTWLHQARRDLLVQAPRHREAPASVFSLRSPVRPNPLGIHVVRIVSLNTELGTVEVDALDCLDRTPILDIKPWRASVDIPPEPSVPG